MESGHVSPYAPYYKMKYRITDDTNIVPEMEILSLIKTILKGSVIVPELHLYVRLACRHDG